MQDFGARVPAYVIAALLGVPPEDRDMVRGWIDESFHLDPETGMSNDISTAAMFSFMEYLGKTLTDRQTNPRDDMFTDLVNMEITEDDGVPRRLTLEQAVNFAALIGSAGTETVARMLGWAALALDDNPDQRAELVADASLIPNAVEEVLRYEAPSPVQSRWCTEDVEVHGGKIPARSKVVMITGSAGRDERAYPDADRFDIHRKFDHHLSFGYGIHFCLGAALARTEGRIALEETFKRFPEWSVDMAGGGPALHEHGPGLHQAADLGLSRGRLAPPGGGQRLGLAFESLPPPSRWRADGVARGREGRRGHPRRDGVKAWRSRPCGQRTHERVEGRRQAGRLGERWPLACEIEELEHVRWRWRHGRSWPAGSTSSP